MSNNWYKTYLQIETFKEASIEKEAALKDWILTGLLMFFGGMSVSSWARDTGGSPEVLTKAINAMKPKIDFDAMKKMTNDQKKEYLSKLLGEEPKTKVTQKPSVKQNSTTHPDSISLEEALARTIYAEAEGESYDGKKAVASVIYNRAGGVISKMERVVKAKKQFSCWNEGTPKKGHGKAWEDSLKIAKEMISGKFTPTTKHTHYYAPKKVNPQWAKNKEKETVGNHVFLTP